MDTVHDDNTTLRVLRESIREAAKGKGGTKCPCCRKHVQVYKRGINARMAAVLLYLYRWDLAEPDAFHHVQNRFGADKILGGAPPGDHGKLAWWGLTEKAIGEREDGSDRIGLYRITERGKLFVRRKATVTKHCHELLSVPLEFFGPQVTIDDCLRKKFNYRELMGFQSAKQEQAALL